MLKPTRRGLLTLLGSTPLVAACISTQDILAKAPPVPPSVLPQEPRIAMFLVSSTVSTSVEVGDLWFDTRTNKMKIYTDGGWVECRPKAEDFSPWMQS